MAIADSVLLIELHTLWDIIGFTTTKVYSLLANVNSRSRSLYVVVNPSVCLSVCL